MTCTAIIPVRGGSIGVPKKNIRLLAGRPLLSYIVDAAKAATKLTSVIVSTEDDTIAEIVQSLDVQVLRHPMELSVNTASSFGVVQWAVRELQQNGEQANLYALLRATSPLCSSYDIDTAIGLLEVNASADSLVSVTRAWGVHPKKLKRLGPDQILEDFEQEGAVPTRRQDLEPCYIRNAAIYVSQPSLILRGMLWGPHCLGYCMPNERSVNINSEIDFMLAELLIQRPQREI